MIRGRLLPLLLLLFALLLTAGCTPAGQPAAAATPEPSEAAPTPVPTPASTPAPTPVPDKLYISEVMCDNRAFPLGGQLCGWVELINDGTEAVDLGRYALSDDADRPLLCPLPARELAPGGVALLRCGHELSFTPDKKGCVLYLTAEDGSETDRMELPALAADESFTREEGVCTAPTPGLLNGTDNSSFFAPPSSLYISEVITKNTKTQLSFEEFPDMIELCNGGKESVILSDYSLSDSRKGLGEWMLPDVTLQSGEYYTVYCGIDRDGFAPFSLSSEGEVVYLTDKEGTILDLLSVPALPGDRSYGREDGRLCYFAVPTIGKPNSGGSEAIPPAPAASVPSGVYGEPFTVTLSGPGEIRYTLDGSTPNEYSSLYAGEDIPIGRFTTLRFRSFVPGCIPSETVTCNYLMGLPDYDLDLVILNVAPRDFSEYLNTEDSLVRCSGNVALYVDGREEFSVPCGVELFGSGSRSFEKRSYQVHFSAEYGPASLHYKLFADRDQEDFTSFNLRSGSQDLVNAMMRDELLTSLWGECSDDLLTFAYRPVNVYLNGDYRGIYYIREHCSARTVAEHTGADKDSVDILRTFHGPFIDAAGLDFYALEQYILGTDLSDNAAFARLDEWMSTDSAMDYFLAQMWSNNYDTNNARVYRSNAENGRWHFILYDLDVAFYQDHSNSVYRMLYEYGGMLSCMLKNEDFKERMTLRLGELLRGPLAEEKVLQRVDDFADMLRHDMHYSAARFPALNSPEAWEWSVERLKTADHAGIRDWNDELIRQYIAQVQPSEELIRRAFGEEYCPG